jgi:DtxR family Mn-dependent transcriptional regulator
MSPVLEERMRAAIGDARTCPHGHPIEGERETGVPLADVERGAKVLVLRFENEAEDLLHYLMDSGIHPGFKGVVAESDSDDEVTIQGADKSAKITRSVAETVAVRADPSPPQRAALASGQLVFAKERYGR